MKTFILLLAIIGLSGCASFNQAMHEAAAMGMQTQPIPQPPPVNYADPAVWGNNRPSQQTNSQNTSQGSYQLIMVNTPNGLVQKRCKMLNGKAVHCI
jgi:hypothetical protein